MSQIIVNYHFNYDACEEPITRTVEVDPSDPRAVAAAFDKQHGSGHVHKLRMQTGKLMSYFKLFIPLIFIYGCSTSPDKTIIINYPKPNSSSDFVAKELSVTEAGNSQYNGHYEIAGIFNDHPQWKHPQDEVYIRWIGSSWAIVDPIGIAYESNEHLLTEDMATWSGVSEPDPGPYVEYVLTAPVSSG